MYPIADLTAFCRRTTGDIPPNLVGASTTVVGSKMYLYGGRLVAERRMVSDIYIFDLETFVWEKLPESPDGDAPQPRYFHSADSWNNHLIIFGGMAIQPKSDNPEDLCVLNDVRLFDLGARRWLPGSLTSGESSPGMFVPKARYAHLSSVTANRLFVIGGQDLNNVWLDDIHVYDLVTKKWVHRRDYPRHCGTYRSVAVTSDMRVRLPQEEGRSAQSAKLGQTGSRFKTDKIASPTPNTTSPDSLIHLPYSASPSEEYPCDIYLFSNYNFTDVQRELEVFTPGLDGDFTITDRSTSMTGSSFPPGLRFPIGAILGTHLIIAGTYLSQTFQSFSIWSLDLVTMVWSRIDPGSALVGSWFRSCLWPEANKFIIFGNRHGNLVEDYNRRLLSWEHIAVIDLEAFGIYRPPTLLLEIPMQEMGLAALEEGVFADFEIICDDGRKVQCSRKLLEERWPWFKEQRKLFIQAATRAMEAIPVVPAVPLPELSTPSHQDPRPDPRLTPRSFQLSEPYPVTLALLQYLYSMALLTPLQHAPAVLSQLLLISSTYDMPHLQSLVKHAMHRALTFATSVGIYGVSTLCNCRSLQIRALRVVMAYSQKRPTGGRARTDRDAPNGGGSNGRSPNSNPDGSRGAGSDRSSAARPRGMSDASFMRGPSESGGSTTRSSGLPSLNMNAQPIGRVQSSIDPPPKIRHHNHPVEGMRTVKSVEALTQPLNIRRRAPAMARSMTTPTQLSSLGRKPSARRNALRPESVMSLTTEQDLDAIVEMIATSLTVDNSTAPRKETPDGSTSEDVEAFMDSPRPSDAFHGNGGQSPEDSSLSTTPALTIDSSISQFSEPELSDDYGESSFLSPRSPYPTYHLPQKSPSQNWDSDTPSLRSSNSYSSISTHHSLSRAPSFQHLSKSSPGTAAPLHPSPFVEPLASPQGLGVIQERHGSEDLEHEFARQILDLDGRVSRASYEDIKATFDMSLIHHRTVRPGTIRERRQVPELDRLRIGSVTPDTIVPDQGAYPSGSPGASTDSSSIKYSAPSSSSGTLSRLFQKSPKTHKTPRFTKSLEALNPPKDEDKQRKKEMVKARKQQIAYEKARKRAAQERELMERRMAMPDTLMFSNMGMGQLF